MLTLKVLSVLLNYPQAETLEALNEMAEVVAQENLLPEANKNAVLAFINAQQGHELLDLQEQYVDMFDRGRFLSLHIFEHVHGESRDRGQAMVDLLKMYESHGFELDSNELPDYIPLFLEFLSQQAPELAKSLLHDAMPVLSLLGARLEERHSEFSVLFDALAGFAGEPEGLEEIRQQAANEGEDETWSKLDEIWEEEAVSFMGGGSCKPDTQTISPASITRRADLVAGQGRS